MNSCEQLERGFSSVLRELCFRRGNCAGILPSMRCSLFGSMRCSPIGSSRYALSHEAFPSSAYVRTPAYAGSFVLSTIGMGTYLGACTDEEDKRVEAAIRGAIHPSDQEKFGLGGVNVIDTASNYRMQRAERSVGRALSSLFEEGVVAREELFVSTKLGFFPGDSERQVQPSAYASELIAQNIISPSDSVRNMHCMSVPYLEYQLERSLENLQLDVIDLVYLHNSAEIQIPEVGADEYFRRLTDAFVFFERKRQEGVIQYYGMATWSCFSCSRSADFSSYLSLEDCVESAREACRGVAEENYENSDGSEHGFRFIQLPMNVASFDHVRQPWQSVGGEPRSIVEAARELEIAVFFSAPFMNGRMFSKRESAADELAFRWWSDYEEEMSEPEFALSFARAAASESIIGTLVGCKDPAHVKSMNRVLASLDRFSSAEFEQACKFAIDFPVKS